MSGSAERWGPLWGARPADWALSEDQQIPTYEEALRRVGLEPGAARARHRLRRRRLPAPGRRRAAREPFGLDASEALLEVARARLPDADLRVGDMEALPYEDDTFDLVTGFNSFFFANDIVAALREAGRVAKPGAPVVIQVWGPHERNDLEAMKEIAGRSCHRARRTRHPSPTTPSPACSRSSPPRPASTPESAFDAGWALEYPDEDTLRRALVAPAGIAVLVGPDREQEVKDAIVEGLAALPHPGRELPAPRTSSTT